MAADAPKQGRPLSFRERCARRLFLRDLHELQQEMLRTAYAEVSEEGESWEQYIR